MSQADLHSSHMSGEVVEAQKVKTGVLELNGTQITRVATAENFGEICRFDSSDPFALISFGALELALQEINKFIEQVNSDGTDLNDLALISMSITAPYFTNVDDWFLKGWEVIDNLLVCGKKDNVCVLNTKRFIATGKYLLCMNVKELPSGRLELYINDTWIATITEPGVYYKEFTITDMTSEELRMIYKDFTLGDQIRIFSASIHHIANHFYNFLVEKIKSLTHVDATTFVTQEEFQHTLDVFLEQFKDSTSMYLKALTDHKTQRNAHGTTWEDVGAAKADHTHKQYATKSSIKDEIKEQMGDYAKANHNHDSQYLGLETARTIVLEIIKDHINEMLSIDPLIITKGPLGILPGPFAQTNVSAPTTILVPTMIDHAEDSTFDTAAGIITTNHEALMGEAPKVFSLNMEHMAKIGGDVGYPLNFRIMFPTYRQLGGYRLRLRGAILKDWSVFISDTELVHHISADVKDYTRYDGMYVKELYFENVERAPMMTILINEVDILDKSGEWELKVEVLYDDFSSDRQFGITNEEFQFCVPNSGSNRLITVHPQLNKTVISPEVCLPHLPLYVFAGKELTDDNVTYDHSYIPPEYNTVRKGLNVFLDRWNHIEEEEYDVYRHPAFGTLSLEQGGTKEDHDLRDIYGSTTDGWVSDGQHHKVVISQTLDSDNVLLMGYMLSWRKEDEQDIPDTWTLTIAGTNAEGREVEVVLDSVGQFYPFYSVEDDDIVYHKQFANEIRVKKITLTMESKKDSNPFIALNKFFLYLSEYYYSIPKNTMYLGNKPVSMTCLGRASWRAFHGWKVSNLPIGRSCVVPVNNLRPTKRFTEYKVENPFNSADVTVTIQNYALMTPSPEDEGPAAYVSKITAKNVTIMAENTYRYAVAITRNW